MLEIDPREKRHGQGVWAVAHDIVNDSIFPLLQGTARLHRTSGTLGRD
jgi:hypothetical protein